MSHGAGAAGFPSRNRAALALIFFMHMFAVFGLMRQRPAQLPDAPEMASVLLFPAPAHPSVRPPRTDLAHPIAPAPRSVPAPPHQHEAPAKPAPADSSPAATPADAAPATPPALEDARSPITVQDAIREQKAAEGGFSLNLSKRQAGRIDRALRKGKSGVPDEPDTPMGRFRRGLEAAHIDLSTAVLEDSYTSPDGVVIYRKRIGKASFCRRSGSVSPLGMRGMVMGNEAGDVPCPKGVQWKSD
jgi:hypothetical protein